MKRKLSLILAALAIAATLSACGKFECESCGHEVSGKKYKASFLGESLTVCKDCYDDLKAWKSALG